MRFMKQSRLTTEKRWGNWEDHFGNVTDMGPKSWENIADLRDMLCMDDSRQCRHCNDILSVRLKYPGTKSIAEREQRVAGRHPKKSVRADEERKAYNLIWTEKYNQSAGIGGGNRNAWYESRDVAPVARNDTTSNGDDTGDKFPRCKHHGQCCHFVIDNS